LDDQLIKESLKQALLDAYDPASNLPYEVEAPIIGGARAVEEK